MKDPKQETTIVLVKPDCVKRGLIGEILERIESRGLKVIGLKMLQASEEHAHNHYPNSETWLRTVGEKTFDGYKELGKDAIKELGTDDPIAIGKMVANWNVDYLTSGPMIAMAIRGIHAIKMVRKIVGHTYPAKAEMGTIRGDFSVDSPTLANTGKRAVRNLVHASGDPEEATHELKHWFKAEELHDYKRAEEDIMF